jgi:hypothetical protein
VERGLLDADGELTEAGAQLRQWVEGCTDRAAATPWLRLGEKRTDRLSRLLEPLARRLAEGNDVMRVNPMGLDARRLLSGASAP